MKTQHFLYQVRSLKCQKTPTLKVLFCKQKGSITEPETNIQTITKPKLYIACKITVNAQKCHKIDEPSESTVTQGRGRGRGGGRAGGRSGSASGRVRGRRRCSPVSTILWSATTPENDQAPPAQQFSGSPGPITDLPDDPQLIHFFE